MTLDRCSEEEKGGDQKFYLHDCPFFPRNTLRSRKHFIDDHNYKYCNINYRNKAFNYHRDKLDRIITDEDNGQLEKDDFNKNSIHIHHYKNYKNAKEINTKSRSNDLALRAHESQGNSINHGRGKEKLLNPRKNMCDGMGRKNRDGEKHYIRMNNEDLTANRNCSNVSQNIDTSFSEKNDYFDSNDDNDFTMSAQITVTTDIPEQRSSEHPPRLEKIVDSKHDYHSLTFPNEENHTNLIRNEIVAKEKSAQPVFSTGFEDMNSEKAMKSHRDFVLLQLQEAEEIKKLFSDRNNVHSRIKDLYEEEQFLYDPDSKQVSHIVLTKSRSCNFLEYFKSTNKLKEHILPIPTKELEILGNTSLKAISLPNQHAIENGMLSREKQPLVKTVMPPENGKNVQDLRTKINWKDLMPNEKILIIERKKSLPSNMVTNSLVEYLKVEGCSPNEFQKYTTENSFNQKKSVTLPPIHKRPELQKRYFYNEFKTYKRKYSEDDLLYADQVKSTKDKFEKIFSKIINRKRASTLNNNQSSSKESILEKPYDTRSLKRSQRFVSEDNICLRKTQESRHLLNNTCSTEKLNEPLSRQSRNNIIYRSLMKIKFTPRKKKSDDTEKSKPKDEIFKVNGKMTSVDNISTNESDKSSPKCERQLISNEDKTSDKKLSQDNCAQINNLSDVPENNTKGESICENVQTNKSSRVNRGKVQIKDDGKIENGKVQTSDDERSILTDIGNETQIICKKPIRFSPQPETVVNAHKKESLYRPLVNKVGENVISPNVTEPKTESDEKNSSVPYYKQNVIDEIYRRDSDTLESFGRPVSEEVLIKIRDCGTSITYFGGRVINRKYGPMCSPMTMTILNEIKQYMSVLNEHFQKPRDEGRKI